jgi:hypothetical protein
MIAKNNEQRLKSLHLMKNEYVELWETVQKMAVKSEQACA